MNGNVSVQQPDMTPEELSKVVVGAAMRVMNELGPGLREKPYENALVLELQAHDHYVEQQTSFPIKYRGRPIGCLVPDIIVDRLLVVDPKVVECIGKEEVAQMLTYLNITGLELALIINFRRSRIEWRLVHK